MHLIRAVLSAPSKQAFSLFEVSIALLITGLIAGGAMTLFNANSRHEECYAETKVRLDIVREAINRYAQSNERFPLPARRTSGADSPNYGREVAQANAATELDVIGTGDDAVVFGAIPFATLNIATENAVDCWGNKLTYVVTQALTEPKDASGNNKFLSSADGKINVFTSPASAPANPFLQGAGFAVISHGADELGAVKANYNPAVNDRAGRKWCDPNPASPIALTSKTANCAADSTSLISAPYNDGKATTADFFDDLIVYRGKPWLGIVNGACSVPLVSNTCSKGTVANYMDGGCDNSKTWQCVGSGGGATASCSIPNAACAPPPPPVCPRFVIYWSYDGYCGPVGPTGIGDQAYTPYTYSYDAAGSWMVGAAALGCRFNGTPSAGVQVCLAFHAHVSPYQLIW